MIFPRLKRRKPATGVFGYWVRTGDGSFVDCIINIQDKPEYQFRNVAQRVADSATKRTRILHHLTPMEVIT